ncbi:sucB [Symbiodinium natans]|uniref:SucB protein n=1 Tax=Symbiodinium natans TaxID=878477 RepID=A0A812Q0W1_9DINO|nr:sucB [Symbiodinium natans]
MGRLPSRRQVEKGKGLLTPLASPVLAKALAPGARVVLVGPHAAGAGREPAEALLGPVVVGGLQVSVFPQTYQRLLVRAQDLEAPQLVVLFHPGLDVHYFAWYPCLRHWAETRVPVLITAYRVPGGLGETPQTVQTFLETLVGTGGGAGLWVIEEENPHRADDGAFNAGYFVTLGSQGALPPLAEEMYWPLFQALQKIGHPFAPRVGYLDLENESSKVSPDNLSLLSAIAEAKPANPPPLLLGKLRP